MPRQLLPPDAVAGPDVRASGIPPGMEGQVGQEESQATPQEEAQLEQAVTKMRRMVHGRSSRNQVVDQLNDKDVPVQTAVGRTAAGIVGTIEKQAKASGVKLSPELVVQLGMHTVDELLEVGIAGRFFPLKAGTPEFQKVADLSMLEGAKFHGEQLLRGPDAGKLSEEAQNSWAHNVAQEVDDGTASPDYLAATRGGGPAAAPPGGRQLIPQEMAQ